MRHLFLFSFLISLCISLKAQTPRCGTMLAEEDYQLYASLRNHSKERSSERYYIPIAYHCIARSNGTGVYRLRDLLTSHCQLNEAFDSLGFEFYIHSIDTIANTSYYEFSSYSVGNTIKSQNNVPSVCNVYLNNDPNGVCGYATFPGSSLPGIFVKHGCFGPGSTTLIHEMGHYIGLVHTFETAYGIEFVNGTNCSTHGDLFCDTPADFLDYRWNCPYAGSDLDPNGDPYLGVIDEKFFMSYSDDDCMNRFSNEQKEHMRDVLPTQRASHLYQPMPSNVSLPAIETLYPLSSDTSVSPSATTFVWRAVPGATHYNLLVPDNSPLVTYVDVLTTDTFFTATQLLPNRQYRWRVKPLSFGNVCEDFSPLIPFKTSSLQISVSVTQPLCTQPIGAITANVLNGTPPFSYLWSDGSTTSQLSGLLSGTYSLTVTDSAGLQSMVSVVLAAVNAPQLSIQLDNSNTTLISSIVGGGSGVNYFWSSGATSANLQNVLPGTYSLTAVTSNGCSATQTISVPEYGTYNPPVSSSLIDILLPAELNVYPNPANDFLNIESISGYPVEGCQLLDLSGKVLLFERFEKNSAVRLPLPSLGNGVFLLRIQTANRMYNKKLMITR